MAEKKVALKNYGGGECSEIFERAFRSQFAFASQTIECDACGRWHFDDEPSIDYEAEKIDRWMRRSADDPARYIPHQGFVRWFHFLEMRIVYKCPCGFSQRLGESIWDNRASIVEYFRKRIDEQSRDAQRDEDLLKLIPDV